MCKQEDYFKKLIYMHNKKNNFHVMQAQGGPSRAALRDKGQRSTPDSHLTENLCSNQQSASTAEGYPDAVYRSIFPLEIKIWLNLYCTSCLY